MEGLRIGHQLVDAHPLRQVAFLGEIADATQHADRLTHWIETEDAHRSGRSAQQSKEMFEEGRLAGAVSAHESVDLAGGGAEGHVVQRALAPE